MALVAVLIGTAGCGGGHASVGPTDRAQLAEATTDVAFYCAYGGPKGARAVRTLVAQLREHGDAEWTFGGRARTVRETVSDASSKLEGCNRRYARQLDRALRAD